MLKYIYLVGSLIATVIILIFAFGNIQAICVDMMIFFTEIEDTQTPTILIFWISGLGVICGFFYHGLLNALFSKSKDDDEDEDY